MFNKPKEVPQCPDPFKDKVKCETCRCWVDKSDAQKVSLHNSYGLDEYYCRSHKKPYSEFLSAGCCGRTEEEYYARVQVDKDGVPVGYKPIK